MNEAEKTLVGRTLVGRLHDIAEHDWRLSFLAHTSDTAREAANTITRLTSLLSERDELLKEVRAFIDGAGYPWHEDEIDARAQAEALLTRIDSLSATAKEG